MSLSEEIPCQNTINLSLFLSPSPPAVLYPPRVSLFPPAVSLLLFLPFPFALSYSSSSFRIAWRGGPAARLTVLGASYTFTPVCAFFRERTCPFHVPLERARYIYPPFIKYVYTNGQQTDVVDPIVSGASRYLEDSWAELRARSPIVEFWNRSPFVRTIVYFDIQSTVRARQWYGTTDQRQAVQIRRVPLGLPSARRQGFRHATRRAKGESIWIIYLTPYFMSGLHVNYDIYFQVFYQLWYDTSDNVSLINLFRNIFVLLCINVALWYLWNTYNYLFIILTYKKYYVIQNKF